MFSTDANLTTQWGKSLDSEEILPEYPRPQFRRDDWINLNGEWEYAIRKKGKNHMTRTDGTIRVPFPIESKLSGVERFVSSNQELWYRRAITVPDAWHDRRILLHFGAVDYECTVRIDGNAVGSHRGGYTSFTFDVTSYLSPGQSHDLTVSVWDPTSSGNQQRGKQSWIPFLTGYTPVTGIWQTVWLEPVPASYMSDLKLKTDLSQGALSVDVSCEATSEDDMIIATVRDESADVVKAQFHVTGSPTIEIPSPDPWWPHDPNLYQLDLELVRNSQVVDRVESYFGMREIDVDRNDNSNRIRLNGEPYFQHGVLDQGYWPDGLYTAPADEALQHDIKAAKDLGFNMIRKHLKVEPARWYYHCDRLGMLVWQDIPNGASVIAGALSEMVFKNKVHLSWGRTDESKRDYRHELGEIVVQNFNKPSIVTWIPFNEGWGQFDTAEITEDLRSMDSTRLIDSASGWIDYGCGDIEDVHSYPGPERPDTDDSRAKVCGEYGGFGHEVEDHAWNSLLKWSYRSFATGAELTVAYELLMETLEKHIKDGLSAAVYTQLVDVEGEINGLYTYDREVLKGDVERIRAINTNVLSTARLASNS